MPRYTVSHYGRNWLFQNPSMYSQERSFKAYGAEFTCGKETEIDFFLPEDDKRFDKLSDSPFWTPILLYVTNEDKPLSSTAVEVEVPYHDYRATLYLKNTDTAHSLEIMVNDENSKKLVLEAGEVFEVELPRHLISKLFLKSADAATYMLRVTVAAPKF